MPEIDQQEVFALFSNSLLEAQLINLDERIQELQGKYDLIAQELARRAINEN